MTTENKSEVESKRSVFKALDQAKEQARETLSLVIPTVLEGKKVTEEKLASLLQTMGLAKQEDLAQLETRIRKLEATIEELQSQKVEEIEEKPKE
ncbi:MAG: hypothetical protein CL678_10785 [Bdellovibrionaceae bacterium]|nr:hypothetical protein [Pseudobdellovibrionaceae bacterium]|tara:strand:- start:4161 stop:4445 length:285 start_codon:yes stop_codon:yes gene_type:complete